jgi:hypothetical protein
LLELTLFALCCGGGLIKVAIPKWFCLITTFLCPQ